MDLTEGARPTGSGGTCAIRHIADAPVLTPGLHQCTLQSSPAACTTTDSQSLKVSDRMREHTLWQRLHAEHSDDFVNVLEEAQPGVHGTCSPPSMRAPPACSGLVLPVRASAILRPASPFRQDLTSTGQHPAWKQKTCARAGAGCHKTVCAAML